MKWLMGSLSLFFILSSDGLAKEPSLGPHAKGGPAYATNDNLVDLKNDFSTEISCHFSCKSGITNKEKVLTIDFSPKALKLSPGNGGLWAGLASGLWPWARGWCLEAAVSQCDPKSHQPSSVSDFKVDNIRSGTWSIDRKQDCSPLKEPQLSPYEETQILAKPLGLFRGESNQTTELKGTVWKEGQPCKNILHAKMCYGDCMCMKSDYKGRETWIQTLASVSDFSTEEETICADSFVESFKSKGLSPSVMAHFCENYFWNTVANPNNFIFKCAALRASIDCDSLIK